MDSILHSKFETYLLDEEQYKEIETSISYEKDWNVIENFPEGFFSEL